MVVGVSWLSLFHCLLSETASEEDTSVPACSRVNSESSVLEELGSLAVDSGPSKVSKDQGQLRSPEHTTATEETIDTQELESSASPGKSVSELDYNI